MEWRFPRAPYLWKNLVLQPSFRFEKYFGKAGAGYPSVHASVSPDFFPSVTFYAGLTRAVRYPDFNSLFWSGDARAMGNPDLQPEKKKSTGWGINFRSGKWFLPRVQLHHFSEEIEGLIYWQRSLGVWKPQNLLKAEQNGWDLFVEQPLNRRGLVLTTAYHRMEAINRSGERNTDGKKIVFVPSYTLDLSLSASYRFLHGTASYRAVGPRETVAANSRDTRLDPYDLFSISLGARKKFGNYEAEISFRIKNLADENYQLIYGYPMPGREFLTAVSIKRIF